MSTNWKIHKAGKHYCRMGKTANIRSRRWRDIIFGICFCAWSIATMGAPPSTPDSAKPEWQGSTSIESPDGKASLSWKLGKGNIPEFFRLTEKVAGETRISYITGEQLELNRFSPGVYLFSLEGCFRDSEAVPVCSSRSKELSLTVPDSIYQPYLQPKPTEKLIPAESSSVNRGPAELRPGKWFNPDKSGIGWSMYWSNRLALSQNPSDVFDLQVIWYTYEAKKIVAYCDGPNDTCPPLVQEFHDYRPVVATMNLVKHQSNNTYVGAITIRRKGVNQNVGNATVSFSLDNTLASIQWSAAFKKESLSGNDNIMLLAGGDGSAVNDSSGFAGLWGNTDGSSFISANIGTISQTLEAVFYDDNNDPTWIMAHRYEPGVQPASSATDLCYYYTPGGYPPNLDQPGLLSPFYTTCDPDNATSISRNGLRFFSTAEAGHFWVSFTLPPGLVNDNAVAGGSLNLGTASVPVALPKAANRHRIWFSGPGSCEISASVPSCTATLSWFSDSDYPSASAWVFNQTSGQRNLIELSTTAAMVNRLANLDKAGSYRFELYQGNTPDSTLLATSSTFTVSQAIDAPLQPTGLRLSWTNESTRSYRVDWNHAATASVAYYQLIETLPSGSSTTYNVSPGNVTTRAFSRSTGPWGNYSYKVKACNSSNQCSAETAAVQWLVSDPNVPSSGTLQQPWKSNQYGNLAINLGYQYAMGYYFTPAVSGQVTQLGGFFNGTRQVKLFHRHTGNLLASASVTSSNNWSFVNIPPVNLAAGEQYTVAAYLAGSGASAMSSVSFPKTYGDITILASAYASTSSNANAVPMQEQSLGSMYGQADIGFVAASATQQPPVISAIAAQSHLAGSTVSLQVSASDPDGQVVGFSANGLPPALTINNSGLVSGTINTTAASASAYTVTITATDNHGLTAQRSFSWTVTAPPSGSTVFSDSFEVGEWNNLWTEDSQNDWFQSTQRASEGLRSAEVDGAASNAQLISMPINLNGSASAVVEFDWYIESGLDAGEYVAFDVSTNGGSSWEEKKRLRGDADPENSWRRERIELSGLSALRLRFRGMMSASDEDANVDHVKVATAAVSNNTAPVITPPASQSHVSGSTITPLQIVVTDAEKDLVSCSITGLPSGLSEASECLISGTVTAAANTYVVSVTASDGKANSAPVSFNWLISAVPVANPDTPPPPSAMPSMAISSSSSRVGATAGKFRVTEAGQASYSIPIMVAPGSGGFSPQVSLDYSSGSGNGLVGLGWAVGGQSAISRCAQTLEQDGPGAIRGVSLTMTDRFCLDGQRLMLIAGNYGAANSEYRTEIDSITKVVANHSAGQGPLSFTVWRKDGSITEYGNSADSRIEARAADNQTVLLWAQSKITDSAGNYINYSYQEMGAATGDTIEFTLQKIAYTGNARAGTAPFAELNFTYDDVRQDKQVSYLAGAKLQQSKRLVRIDSSSRIEQGSPLQSLRSYMLSYSADPFGRSLLSAVKECRDSSQAYCFPATVFDWQQRDDAINTATTGSFNLPSVLYGLVLADTNGDSRPDLLYTQKSGGQYQLRTAVAQPSGGFSIASAYSTLPKDSNDQPVKVTAADLNADGRQDLIYTHDPGTGPKWYAQLSGGSTAFNVLAAAASDKPSLVKVMDLDGDGLPDLLYGHRPGTGQGQELVWQRNTYTPGGSIGLAAPQAITVELAALFPDNIADNDPAISDRWYISDEHPSFATEANPVRSQIFDFNGDGAVDLLVKVARQYCQGQCGFEGVNAAGGTSPDGLLDITEWSATAGNSGTTPINTTTQGVGENTAIAAFWVVYESNGLNNFKPPRVVARDSSCTLNEVCDGFKAFPLVTDPQPADVNADGLADLLYRQPDGPWQFQLNTGNSFADATSIDGYLSAGMHFAAQMHDFNGDGWPDLVYPNAAESASAKWAVHLNQGGRGYSAAQLTAAPAGNSLDKDFGVFADFNGDAKTDHLFINLSSVGEVQGTELRLGGNRLSSGSTLAVPSSQLTAITDGLGARTTLSYRPLTDPVVYTRMNDASKANWGKGSVVYDFVAPVYLVSRVESLAPTYASASASSTMEYHFVGAKFQAGGRGFLGFGEVISFDPQTGIRTNKRYRQDFPFVGMPADTSLAKVSTSQKFHTISNAIATGPTSWGVVSATTTAASLPNGTRLSYAINQWQKRETHPGKGVWYPYLANSLERAYTLVGGFSRKVLTTNTYNNDYGNLDGVAARTYGTDGSTALATQTTTNVYSDNASLWHLGRLLSSTVTHARSGKSSILRNSSFAYDATTGILSRETIEPGSTQFEVITSHQLDLFGNRLSSTVKGYGMPERVSSQSYDALGRFVIETRNALNQLTSKVVQFDVFGNSLQVESIDGVKTVSGVDYLGRLFISWTETGTWQKTLMSTGSGAYCPAGRTAFHSIRSGGGQPGQHRCSDILGREIRTATESFNGSYVFVDTEYDESGRVAQVSEPYFSTGNLLWNETVYDILGRVSAVLAVDGNDMSYDYDEAASLCGKPGVAGQVLTNNGLSQKHLEVRNALGEVTTVYDQACGQVSYDYDSVGNLVKLTGTDGIVTTMSYDAAGRKTSLDDDDKGYWQYAYNPLGEMTRQIDSKAQAMDFAYDVMGRVTTRHERTAVSSLSDSTFTTVNTESTTWINSTSTAVKGKGQASSVIYQLGISGATVHEQSYTYDSFGRPGLLTHKQDGLVLSDETTYDQFGRVFQQFDASGDDRGVRYHYNSRGYLERLQESREGSQGLSYQQILGQDQRGNVTAMALGNGVTAAANYHPDTGRLVSLEAYDKNSVELQSVSYSFDVLGNLKSRHDTSDTQNLKETFNYDALNRLEQVLLSTNGAATQTMLSLQYSVSGNITNKSDVGAYLYGQNGAGAHAVTTAGSITYSYDSNGNQISSSDGRSITYTLFDQASRVQRSAESTEFQYGVGNQRIKRLDSNAVDGKKTTWYFGSAERIQYQGENPFFRRSIGGVAVVDFYPASGASNASYLVKDHLGSIHTVTDQTGLSAKATRMHFGAFGERQNLGWTAPISQTGSQLENMLNTRGFTGHEHADGLGIIHMNGRIYDPKLGRFLQADPFVQGPKNSQSLNRYSYVQNNPLSYTDPTGYFSLSRFIKKWGRVIVAAVATYVTWGAASGWAATFAWGSTMGTTATLTVTGGVVAGAISGAVGGLILTGTLKGTLQGAVSGAILGGVVGHFGDSYSLQRIAADSISGGLSSEIYGQEFKDGLLFGAMISSATFITVRLRAYQKAQSELFPGQVGEGGTFRGIDGKLAGERVFEEIWKESGAAYEYAQGKSLEWVIENRYLPFKNKVSPLGGLQGGERLLFGQPYSAEGLVDHVLEGFSGVHDTLNQPFFYTAKGTNRLLVGFWQKSIGYIINPANVVLASPVVVPALLPDYMRHLYYPVRES